METSPLPKTLFPFIIHSLKGYKGAVFFYTFLSLAAGMWGPLNSILLKQLIDALPNFKTHSGLSVILPASLIVINFVIFDNVTWRGITYTKYKVIPFLLNKIDNALLDYTLQHSHQFFQERMSGTLSKQIFHVIDGIEKILSSSICHILRAASLLLMSFIFAWRVNPIFFQILALWSLFFFSISLYMSQKLTHLSERQASKESILGGQIIDSLTHAFNIHIFARRTYEIDRRTNDLSAYQKAYQKKEWYALMMHCIQGGLIALMMAFSTFFLLYLYAKNLVTVGDFALILGLSMETGHMMWHTMSEVDDFNKAVGRCKQGLDSLMVPIDIVDARGAGVLKCEKGGIQFDKVSFHYKDSDVLFDALSVTIEPGQKVGLVGYSGGGKSSFINLILRLYDVGGGSILIDGQDIRSVTQDSLRNKIGTIPQDPSLFHRSLMENIRYGCLDATDDQVILAAKKAYADDFIQHLPQGYQSLVGERGIKLSGGQKQRISIARAILKNAPILILDEATSQLDSVTEVLIQESLWDLMQHKTTIVIAHRLSTLLHMDRILVFDQGKIIEDGSHEALFMKEGVYKRLWDAQVGGFLGDVKG